MEQLTGRLTADAKVSTVKGDKKVVNFNIAINDSYRSNGETVRVTTYVDCAYWINAAIAEYLKKGLLVELSGRIGSRAWLNKDGEAQSTVTLNVSNVKFLGGASGGNLERQDGKSAKKEMEYRQLQEDTLYELMQAGAHILRDISDPAQLLKIEQVVRRFQHRDEAELELEFLGLEFLALYQKYPKLSLMDCTRPDMVYPDEPERISPDMYTGFYWSARDCFADEIDSMISNHFNETPVMDEPAVIRTFEAMPDGGANELEFAKKLFGLMEMLKDILIRYDHDNGSIPPEN